MKDLQNIAHERASKGRELPVGSSFESQHKREKKALMKQIESLDGRMIHRIDALPDLDEDDQAVIRVAAYCRVSTDDLDQAISIALQRKTYSEMIKANPKWKHVGTYVDDGFSGTNTQHRQGFLKLMEDALAGKIDMIITKSVSRFARNLVDCITWVDALRNHNVWIYFEAEQLNTKVQTSGIILGVLSLVAEEESHMKSEAILLSIESRFSRGRFMTPRLFGFDVVSVPDGYGYYKNVLKVNEAEERVVRWIYFSIVNGADIKDLAEILTELAIPTGGRKKDGSLNTHWTEAGICSLCRNEKHCGDVLARKTYTKSYKDHKVRKNRGAKNKYFQPHHHHPIVPRHIWNAVQRILNSRKYGHEGAYLPMKVIEQGPLAGYISVNPRWDGYDIEDYYRVSQIAMGILDGDLSMDLDKEFMPDEGRKLTGMIDDHGISKIARELSEAEKQMKAELEGLDQLQMEERRKEEIIRTFQVVSADFFTHTGEPYLRVSRNRMSFTSLCRRKVDWEYTEILFNPVERVIIARPAKKDNSSAVIWNKQSFSAAPLCKIIFACAGWDPAFNYQIPCQTIHEPDGDGVVLAFDLDNSFGVQNIKRKTECPDFTGQDEGEAPEEGKAKGYYFPPEEDSEPQELKEMEERFRKAREQEAKLFGEPYFMHSSGIKEFDSKTENGVWDMMAEARPIDTEHRVDQRKVEILFQAITEDPPVRSDDNRPDIIVESSVLEED